MSNINTEVANSREKSLSVSKGTKCIMGIDIQTQQKITAKLIQATTSFSESGKLVSPASSSDLALILQGDSLIKKEIGTAIKI